MFTSPGEYMEHEFNILDQTIQKGLSLNASIIKLKYSVNYKSVFRAALGKASG